ncbi:MAG TPA: YqhA family protein [Gammaproteobacteria bacterium]|nr:YqhA family protein [Gammaproteobacteria bacterium]
MKRLETTFENLLWNSRFVVLIAVVSSLLIAFAVFFVATMDAIFTVYHALEYGMPGMEAAERATLRASIITHVVEIVDGYLLATVLLIFSLGLYELFISKIDLAENSETSSNVLLIRSLDDLKNRLAKVILMILIVRFFEYAIGMKFTSALDLLMLSGGIALIGLALYLSHVADGKH